MTTVKIQPRFELTAVEITAEDFDRPPYPTRVKGLVYSPTTRTVRLMSEDERRRNYVDTKEQEDDEEEAESLARYRQLQKTNRRFQHFGCGCWVIVKNDIAVEIITRETLSSRFQVKEVGE